MGRDTQYDELAWTQALHTASGFCAGVAMACGYSDRIGEGRQYPAAWEAAFDEVVDTEHRARLAELWWSHSSSPEDHPLAASHRRIAESARRIFTTVMAAGSPLPELLAASRDALDALEPSHGAGISGVCDRLESALECYGKEAQVPA